VNQTTSKGIPHAKTRAHTQESEKKKINNKGTVIANVRAIFKVIWMSSPNVRQRISFGFSFFIIFST
jgi:hypothetical protein